VDLEPRRRTWLVDRILGCLEEAAPGSRALLRGSLAANTADEYSDIDVLWEVPDADFQRCVASLEKNLSRVRPVACLRSVPEFQNSQKRRLIFVRFESTPLFWRLDLDIFARSIQRDPEYDLNNPNARGSNWSLTESALMNGVAAVKAHLRGKNEEARQLLVRAYRRVGLEFPNLELGALILKLADEVSTLDPKMVALAEDVRKLVVETFGSLPQSC
jgi:predicted nucleotidyltransferase